jgi:hypothetical protein
MFLFGCLIEAAERGFEKRLLRQSPVLFAEDGRQSGKL